MSNQPVFSDAILPPTAARWGKGDVRRAERQIQDVTGSVGDPFITILLLARLHSEGKITNEEAGAGDRFHLELSGER